MLVLLFVAIVFALTPLPNPPELGEAIFHLIGGSVNIVLAVFICIISFMAILWVAAGILHLVASLLHGRGNYLGVVCGLSFAIFPLSFLAPLAFLRAILASVGMGVLGSILFLIGSLILFIWLLILEIIAIRQNYSFSTGKAIVTYFIPGIALVIIPLLVAGITAAI